MFMPPINYVEFRKTLREIKYPKNSVNIVDGKKVKDYYINHLTNKNIILEKIDRIYEESKKPFKIKYDFGFVTEDKRNVTYDIRDPLAEYGNKHRVSIIINDKQSLEEFKQTILNDLNNFSDYSTGSSSIIYVGLHSIVFQVSFLKKGGAKNTNIISGYEWLKNNKYIKHYDCDSNLCLFNCIANHEKFKSVKRNE